jgi:hypothetical protein
MNDEIIIRNIFHDLNLVYSSHSNIHILEDDFKAYFDGNHSDFLRYNNINITRIKFLTQVKIEFSLGDQTSTLSITEFLNNLQ